MSIEKRIISFLKTYKKRTIPLSDLEQQIKENVDYSVFASTIQYLTDKQILLPVKSHGTSGKSHPLFNTYRIIKANLRESLNSEIQSYSIMVNPEINLDTYFLLSEEEWNKDLPYIKKINSYLNKKGLPSNYVTIPERSFQLVGDEKWIDEKDGKRLLERIKLWDKLKIITNPDPLMMAINPLRFSKTRHIHLVVENKATFYALLESIKETDFTSLIYGAGWKIASNIDRLPTQIGLAKDLHKIYYFGDIDPEGISIWHLLYEKNKIELALPFYKALLKKDYSIGKENQQKNMEAFEKFKAYFSEEEKLVIDELIHKQGYLPQEGLKKEELKDIWRKDLWIFP